MVKKEKQLAQKNIENEWISKKILFLQSKCTEKENINKMEVELDKKIEINCYKEGNMESTSGSFAVNNFCTILETMTLSQMVPSNSPSPFHSISILSVWQHEEENSGKLILTLVSFCFRVWPD